MNFLRRNWYQLFKYSVYTAVFINVILFLRKEWLAGLHRFSEGITLENFVGAFTSTIDTAAWVLLLFLFELETYVIPDDKLKGRLQWIFKLIRSACYVVIVTSLLGYISEYFWLDKFERVAIKELCAVEGKSWMKELDEFETISQNNCKTLAKSTIFLKYQNKAIYTDQSLLKATYHLAIVDILNSLAWILVVIVLEIDIWLQLRGRFNGYIFILSKRIKNILYAILFLAAIYWGAFGDFLEFWDAFLWIIAFVFIELNLFEWKRETEGKKQ